ncbi:MAG: hypothetical protein PHF29_07995 [Candidatus Riflebacteria bacterium]|nr:hypothetical protein [Candidatus Riflebacteria bacterium]
MLIIFAFIVPQSLCACDSTILSLLTGTTQHSVVVTKMLAVSQKLQLEGEMLNAFNIANAKNMHKEIMENWLQIVSELYSNNLVGNNYKEEFSAILIEVSKDLGTVRKNLNINNTNSLHEIIEACITKISLLGAIINDDKHIYEFLRLELNVYKPRPYLNDFEKFSKMTDFVHFDEKIGELKKSYSEKAVILADELSKSFKVYRNIIKSQEKDKYITAYNNFVNTFILLKKQLLDDKYF